MINHQANFIKINNHVKIFNNNTLNIEKIELLKLLEPIRELLESHEKNSIYIYKNGGLFHVEGLIRIGDKYASANAVGCSLKESIMKLVPKLIESTNINNLFPRNRQLNHGGFL